MTLSCIKAHLNHVTGHFFNSGYHSEIQYNSDKERKSDVVAVSMQSRKIYE